MQEIFRLKCHVCNKEFAIMQGEGKMCANCGEPTCNTHLSAHKVIEKTLYICAKCIAKSNE
jgi:rRNA maturation endonuclease Nob1